MKMRVRTLSAACALLCAVGSLLLTRCADKGTDPPPDGPKDYAVFIGDYSGNGERMFRYRVISDKLDSTTNIPPLQTSPAAVSADGKRLYWYNGQVTDAETFEMLPDHPYGGFVVVSPDNRLVAFCGTDLFIVRTSDYGLVFHDTGATTGATFSAHSQRFYAKKASAGGGTPAYELYVLDLEHGNQVTRRYIKGGMGTESLVVSPDETKMYLYRKHGTFLYSFDVYDLALDSIVFTRWLIPGHGSLAQTPDGREVYFTSPSGMLEGPPPTFSLAVYHTETMTIDSFFSYARVCTLSDSTRYFTCYTDVVITPDGRWLVGTSFPNIGTIFCKDLRDGIETTRCLPGKWFKFPRIQNGL